MAKRKVVPPECGERILGRLPSIAELEAQLDALTSEAASVRLLLTCVRQIQGIPSLELPPEDPSA